jgi:hypothetical protein
MIHHAESFKPQQLYHPHPKIVTASNPRQLLRDLRIMTKEPFGPGTAPRTNTTFVSLSSRTTRKLRTVTRSAP